MPVAAITVVDEFYAAWKLRDVAGVLAVLSPVVRFTQHFDDPALPFTGTSIGIAGFEKRLRQIFKDWQFLSATVTHQHILDDSVRTHCGFEIQHQATGRCFTGTLRHYWVVRDGAITQIDEYLAALDLMSFVTLLQQSSDPL